MKFLQLIALAATATALALDARHHTAQQNECIEAAANTNHLVARAVDTAEFDPRSPPVLFDIETQDIEARHHTEAQASKTQVHDVEARHHTEAQASKTEIQGIEARHHVEASSKNNGAQVSVVDVQGTAPAGLIGRAFVA